MLERKRSKKMKKDVLLSIRGLHMETDTDHAEPVEIITPAEYYMRNGKQYILYDELNEEKTSSTKVRIKISDTNCIEITKNGSSSTHMLFERGKKNLTCYNTPFGSLMIAIITNQIQLEQNDSELSLKIDYLLEANYEPMADCCLSLHLTDKDSSLFSLEH